MDESPCLRFQLLGRFGIEVEGRRVGGFRCRRVQELIARLVLDRGRAHRRESLAEQIWCDAGEGDHRRKLRQALWQAENTLSKASPGLKKLITHLGTEWVQVDPTLPIEVDVEVLEGAALDESEQDPGGERIQAGLEAYRGAFLDGNLSDWCVLERERLNNIYVGMLERQMRVCLQGRDYRNGIDYGIRVLREDRARERAHRRLMRLYYLAGDRTAALRQFDRCSEALAADLDVGPARRTLELARRIREDDPSLATVGEEVASSTADPQAVLDRLMELRSLLRQASGQVQAEIGHLSRVVQGHS